MHKRVSAWRCEMMRRSMNVGEVPCEQTNDKRRRGTDRNLCTSSSTPTDTTANSNPSPRPSWNRLSPTRTGVILDVGCGSGTTTLAAAASAERVVDVDLSQPLVELARRRAQAARITNAEFVIADAQTHDFVAGTFDLLISQFGLMFFDDPVRAFTNIRHALTTDGRAAFVCWQGLHANEWLMLIADAVRRHAELPEFGGQIRGPGMFALCRPDEITTLLGAAGFDQVECDSYTPTILLGGGGNLDDSVDFLLGGGMPAVCSISWTRATAMTYSESCKPNSPIDTKKGSGSAFGRRRGWSPPRHSRLTCSAMTQQCQTKQPEGTRTAVLCAAVPDGVDELRPRGQCTRVTPGTCSKSSPNRPIEVPVGSVK